MIAPAGIGGRTAAAGIGAINHIVVDEGSAVEEFDDGGEADGTARVGRAAASVAVTEKEQRGAETLAAAT